MNFQIVKWMNNVLPKIKVDFEKIVNVRKGIESVKIQK